MQSELLQTELEGVFLKEYRTKAKCYITMNEAFVCDSETVLNINLGSCASVILCGITPEKKVWTGANHLFKPRDKNDDLALHHIAEIYNGLTEKEATSITCLGLFGAGYREKSFAGDIAKKNIINTLEALNFYNLSIELFQTGFSQDLTVLISAERSAFLIKHFNIHLKEKKIIEIPLIRLFPDMNKL